MNEKLESARESRSDLLRQRFDLKEQRRYFRAQLRQAKSEGNDQRVSQVEERLRELTDQLDTLEQEIDALEGAIDVTSQEMDGVIEKMDDLEVNLDTAAQPREEQPQNDVGSDIARAMEKFNGLLTKGFRKMADTIERIDLEKVSEKVSEKAQTAYRTVGDAATEAARSLDNVWSEARESREAPGGIGDYRISGSSTIDGGCYNRIISSGSCKVSSDLVCREMRVSGSFRACGSVDCNGSVRSTGSLTCAGKLIAGNLVTSGSAKIQGDLESGPIQSTGSLNVGGDVEAASIRSSGGLHVDGDVEADSFTTTGALEVGGMVNADTVDIQVSVGQLKVGAIGGSDVRVTHSASGNLLSMLGTAGSLVCSSIEGDQVDLTAVKAEMVRGTNVVIRGGCDIDQVEYSETCTVDGEARVGNCVKI